MPEKNLFRPEEASPETHGGEWRRFAMDSIVKRAGDKKLWKIVGINHLTKTFSLQGATKRTENKTSESSFAELQLVNRGAFPKKDKTE